MANAYAVFIFVVLVNCWFVENVVQAEMNAETVFEFLSRRLDNLLVETASLKSRMQGIESQYKANKNEEITTETARAVRQMVYVEKRLLRETVEKFNDTLAVLESKITEKMTRFDKRIEVETLPKDAMSAIKANLEIYIDEKLRSCMSDLEMVKKRVFHKVQLGDRVVRGPDWDWGDKDGHGAGTVISYHITPGWVYVRWDFNRLSSTYRNGADNSYDLRII